MGDFIYEAFDITEEFLNIFDGEKVTLGVFSDQGIAEKFILSTSKDQYDDLGECYYDIRKRKLNERRGHELWDIVRVMIFRSTKEHEGRDQESTWALDE